MRAALRATLGHPRWWVLSLAGFLVRGGILVLVLPVVALPTIAGLSTLVEPVVTPIVLGGPSPGTIVLAAVLAAGITAAVLATGLIGAFLDVELLDESAAGGTPLLASAIRPHGWRAALTARLLPHAVTALVLAFAASRVVAALYGELTSPTDASIPLQVRVFFDAPEAVVLLVAAWALAEAVGGVALRSLVAGGRASGPSSSRALWNGLRGVLRVSGIATLVATDAAVVLLAVPLWLATSRTWEVLRILLFDGASPPQVGAALLTYVLSWIGGLVVLGGALAWRATAWTAECLRHDRGDASA
jgi:hypothetical protein